MTDLQEGIVLRAVSGIYTVHRNRAGAVRQSEIDPAWAPSIDTIQCALRGNLKKELQFTTSGSFARRVTQAKRPYATDTVAVGDRVRFSDTRLGEGVIEEVLPRRSRYARAGFRGQEQTLVANLDQVVVVFACAEPHADPWKVDRFLAAAEAQGLDAVLVANKADLVPPGSPAELFAEWSAVGYAVLATSAVELTGIDALREALRGRISAFVGPSGVGKSSLLNDIQPGLNLRTGDIGYVTYKGRHTTTAAQLVPLAGGGWVADTPGLRQLELMELDRADLAECFPEFRAYLGLCRFDDCRHETEPGCAVRGAVESGAIRGRRYESFLALAREIEAVRR